MSCDFCYNFFTHDPVNKNICFDIINRCAEIGIKILTFSGGDPFLYPFIYDLLSYADNLGIENHVDTNIICLTKNKYHFLPKYIKLLGIPIDGANSTIHDSMRCFKGHFHRVITTLKLLQNININIKINTVISKANAFSLPGIYDLLIKYRIFVWNIYQFWPLGNRQKNIDKHRLSHNSFINIIKKIENEQKYFKIIGSAIKERTGYRIFVTHTGVMYINNPKDFTTYQLMGSIFDDAVVLKCGDIVTSTIRPDSQIRYNF